MFYTTALNKSPFLFLLTSISEAIFGKEAITNLT